MSSADIDSEIQSNVSPDWQSVVIEALEVLDSTPPPPPEQTNVVRIMLKKLIEEYPQAQNHHQDYSMEEEFDEPLQHTNPQEAISHVDSNETSSRNEDSTIPAEQNQPPPTPNDMFQSNNVEVDIFSIRNSNNLQISIFNENNVSKSPSEIFTIETARADGLQTSCFMKDGEESPTILMCSSDENFEKSCSKIESSFGGDESNSRICSTNWANGIIMNSTENCRNENTKYNDIDGNNFDIIVKRRATGKQYRLELYLNNNNFKNVKFSTQNGRPAVFADFNHDNLCILADGIQNVDVFHQEDCEQVDISLQDSDETIEMRESGIETNAEEPEEQDHRRRTRSTQTLEENQKQDNTVELTELKSFETEAIHGLQSIQNELSGLVEKKLKIKICAGNVSSIRLGCQEICKRLEQEQVRRHEHAEVLRQVNDTLEKKTETLAIVMSSNKVGQENIEPQSSSNVLSDEKKKYRDPTRQLLHDATQAIDAIVQKMKKTVNLEGMTGELKPTIAAILVDSRHLRDFLHQKFMLFKSVDISHIRNESCTYEQLLQRFEKSYQDFVIVDEECRKLKHEMKKMKAIIPSLGTDVESRIKREIGGIARDMGAVNSLRK
ncbi:unnamed protein product [Caenorhabditis angaria]|uniref:Uncharacterized protein n=1 Tax=Caenorhabditis angaria TaxID=860376 RepID=A0A9P1N384_9PELO|nr:unnamed protein product [Caenorhabditis angaria]